MRDFIKRLEALERKRLPAKDRITHVIRQMVEPRRGPNGELLPPIFDPDTAEAENGDTIKREAGESVEAFSARAIQAFPEVPGAVVCLMLSRERQEVTI